MTRAKPDLQLATTSPIKPALPQQPSCEIDFASADFVPTVSWPFFRQERRVRSILYGESGTSAVAWRGSVGYYETRSLLPER